MNWVDFSYEIISVVRLKSKLEIYNLLIKLFISSIFLFFKVKEMTNDILNEWKKTLREEKWLDEESRRNALEKADYIQLEIGYPDYYDNLNFINSNYNVC